AVPVGLHVREVASGWAIRRAIPCQPIGAPADKLQSAQHHPSRKALPDPLPQRPSIVHGDAGSDGMPEDLPAIDEPESAVESGVELCPRKICRPDHLIFLGCPKGAIVESSSISGSVRSIRVK